MILTPRTRVRCAAFIGAVGLGAVLSACSPSNERPSELKVDTATGFVAGHGADPADLPGFIDCVGEPEHRPGSLPLTCLDDGDRLADVRWRTWTADSAEGTATRETGDTTRKVTVELSGPVQSPQGPVFSELAVDGDDIIL